MNKFEEAKALARKLDKEHPAFYHCVGIHYRIVRVIKSYEELFE